MQTVMKRDTLLSFAGPETSIAVSFVYCELWVLTAAGYITGNVYGQPFVGHELKPKSDVAYPAASTNFTYNYDNEFEKSKYKSLIKMFEQEAGQREDELDEQAKHILQVMNMHGLTNDVSDRRVAIVLFISTLKMDETTAAAGESENKDILTEDETEITTVDIGKSDSGRAALIYGISDQPPWIMSFALALQPLRINIRELNQHVVCILCAGYFIDATTIIECLHTFCKSCIVKYLQTSKQCPMCNIKIHETQPLLNLRPDRTMQDIIFKLIPGLFEGEEQRKKQFYKSRGLDKVQSKVQQKSFSGKLDPTGGHYYRNDEQLSLCLELME
ncbi:putative polycomb group RING finger protein 1 [Apostichopus japonicus]|uniref:Putative polycomb group RING finger protein 1 n=1 Tax=Stichopus japonicus TaxID=307972 RepID=A0A2G8LFR3_STIJA|nr:putative polycomb group RING finger protein 1 [Apostichopus japonicus]